MVNHIIGFYVEIDMKVRQDNDEIDRIGLVYIEIEIELLGPI